MHFIDKFNRALLKATPEIIDWNGGAFREVSVPFSFSHEGKKYYYQLKIEKSHPLMLQFGYDKDSVELWDCFTKSMMMGERIDFPERVIDLTPFIKMSIQSYEEVQEVINRYNDGIKQFYKDFYGE